jgi:hypothetical protein
MRIVVFSQLYGISEPICKGHGMRPPEAGDKKWDAIIIPLWAKVAGNLTDFLGTYSDLANGGFRAFVIEGCIASLSSLCSFVRFNQATPSAYKMRPNSSR